MTNTPSVIDFHTHILPKIDHGCHSLEECEQQLKIISSSNTDIAIATSHFYPHVHRLEKFIQSRDKAISNIKNAGFSDMPKICIGAEVLLFENLSKMDGLSELCIKGTNAILLELPMHTLNSAHLDFTFTFLVF